MAGKPAIRLRHLAPGERGANYVSDVDVCGASMLETYRCGYREPMKHKP